ncbi:hypothetical protein [Treponema phagedenis]|uniref:hypothetical protein n=1 Tax=Treponema phagedenis TaxID=162 RepID=UPI0011EE7970|nr:hypothetical protein [Treponema phagedenis]TYT77775.1 hypothetical protein FS559_00855 [Treponema phagedenis]
MYLLRFIEEDGSITNFALFDSIESGQKFVEQIPTYRYYSETSKNFSFVEESFTTPELPDYMQLEYKGNYIPLTKFMFRNPGKIIIDWQELYNLDKPNQGAISGTTLVDAYTIENSEVEEYIKKRENKFELAKKVLEKKSFEVRRAHFGSEDGEAIIYRKKDGEWHYLEHMDPSFTEQSPDDEKEFKKWLEALIKS